MYSSPGSSTALVALLIALLTGCSGAPGTSAKTVGATQPGEGGVPAFYAWTAKVPSTPGRMLRAEPLTPIQSLDNAGQNVRILYTSTDGLNNQPVVVSGALFTPKGTPPKGGWPLMAWAHGTVGSADVCAPSFAGRSGRDTRYLNEWLGRGYAIVATDYEGLGTPGLHPFGLSSPLAYGVLDSIRAVQRADFNLSSRVVVFGQSQGGRAAFATAVYKKTYAPELNIVGVVATGTPYPMAQLHEKHTGSDNFRDQVSPSLAYNLLRLSTAALINPLLHPADYLSDRAKPAFETSQRECLQAIERKVVADGLTFNNSFKRSPEKALDQVNRHSDYPTVKSDIPVFIGTGGKDVISPVRSQIALVKDACRAGDRIEWHYYPQLDHSGAVNGSLPDSTRFVEKAFSGELMTGNCGETKSVAR
ncbi:lipase family protein [Pseudomonas syringae]|uniref:Putative secretory lipase n=1 Tax=Pseudomonas syringae pv. apii TaxID=81036 RepID=A0A3M5WSH6_9PSED|nr:MULTISPECIES: lipase family protein [Pseudomonas syringae group]MCH5512091.1 lipase family protein [Pseudomonas syringae pv. syringae]MCH5637841.1 lipase family protein [Pseudomonas syringae pv. syringae]MCH7426955.1 lipase family protein [Pseudomonas syringae pv. syringae]PBP69717.1 lipase [Pseudomonas syringae]RMU73510.1 putative secretory lipase [Pseudomonas syringae pv. apii]